MLRDSGGCLQSKPRRSAQSFTREYWKNRLGKRKHSRNEGPEDFQLMRPGHWGAA
jgi:hypothetical protein